MTGQTTRLKMPYPTAADPVAGGDDAMKAIADRLDATQYVIYKTNVTVTITASTPTVSTAAVTFPAGLLATANIVTQLTLASGSPQNFSPPGVSGVTAAGCTVSVVRLAGAAATVIVGVTVFGTAA